MGFRPRFDVSLRNLLLSAAVMLTTALLPVAQAHAGYAHIVVDSNNGKVLAASHADTRNYPASLTKMMTLYMAFEAMHKGRLHWNSKIVMTKRAAAAVPLKLGIRAGRSITAREAVLSMIVLSANDSAEAMCDHLAGRKTSCGAMLTRKAHQLGMKSTTFRNGSGLPDRRQVTTARDMARLGQALMRDYPKEYALFSTRSFKFRGRTIHGHNRLMYRYKGMDGIKTGFTNASGFNIVTAVNRDGKHVIGVVMGGRSSRARDNRMAALLDKAMPRASTRKGRGHDVPAKPDMELLTASISKVPVPAPRAYMSLAKTSTKAPVVAAVNDAFSGGWQIQIAAVDSEHAARKLLQQASASAPSRLAGASPMTQPVGDNAGLVRARFAGFASQSAALDACHQLKARSFDCFVLSDNG
jgi:serine-type D-Ala-D-Ala carboxypeptidase (penicillin-binding protein 5/6)